ncbi:hypothetical protein Egran_01227 [Elaphomyces granulatus]|uniref:RING-type domain-containing protein n=1 Tax=Elaphomyces granulatus TaxID=519963 RepID=A0A232M3N4_9EURO|nr:hypothetical protein Egran_01227 [Elaphomyces granulatus]
MRTLQLPSFSRAASASPLPSGENDNVSRDGTAGTATESGEGNSVAAPPANSTTLNEALRNNPFGNTPRSRAIEALTRQLDEQRQELQELNDALVTLAQLFPDVRVEVFRELLTRFEGQSRLQVCVEQLLRYKKEWVKGRWNTPDGREADDDVSVPGTVGERKDVISIPPDERFRSEEYKARVKATLVKEFNGLSRSAVDGVLAEVNFSYARARPILRELARRSWRVTINNLFPSFKRKKDKDEHPQLRWQRLADGELVPQLKETGCEELDGELYRDLVEPRIRQIKEEQLKRDIQLAEELNQREATEANALYECDCCLSDAPFEQISTCSVSVHVICHSCIRQTLHEALFGQGWGNSIDAERSTLRCLAPLSQGTCEGSLSPEIVKNAILASKAGPEMYHRFEDRLALETLQKSQLKLVRCPFCPYAEVDPVYHPSSKGITWRFRRGNLVSTIFMIIILLDMIPLLIIPILITLLLSPPSISTVFTTSLRNLCLKSRSQRFSCANPSCKRVSCITCKRPWRDPHICYEPLLLSLRTTVEAARTAAIKRTCPRCGLAFVKSSGCNKLTCPCGYSMCYLCRKALDPRLKWANNAVRQLLPRPARRGWDNDPAVPDGILDPDGNNEAPQGDSDDEEEEAGGYKHFCEHFRTNPGTRCTECNKCDLYLAEDEEAVARRAGEKAERDWRMRQEMLSSRVTGSAASTRADNMRNAMPLPGIPPAYDWNSQPNGKSWRRPWRYWFGEVWQEGKWKKEAQMMIDWLAERVIVIEDV